MSFTPDVASTEEVLAAVLNSPLPQLPAQEQRLGATTLFWWETAPGEVYIHAEGGTVDDRHYASTLVSLQLEPHGFRRAQFDLDASSAPEPPNYRKATDKDHCGSCEMFDEGICWGYGNKEVKSNHVCNSFAAEVKGRAASLRMERTASWPDLMAKAKRLVQSGQVHVLRNGYGNIIGHVVGDHGEYDTEISRDDPNSRAITGWQCSCPWDQYAWQRTRKWKKFEGRPCSHVLALYWKALATPMDEQLSEEQATGMGTGQKIGPPAQGGPDTHEFGLPRSFGPEGEINQGDQQKLNLPPDAIGHPPGPAQSPLAPPPGQGGAGGPMPPGVLPPFPGEQMEMQWAGPGTTPGGGVSPPGAYTVPGAKPPNPPNNPLQNPGTYSKVGADFNAPEIVRLKNDAMGVAEGPVKGQHGDGGYQEIPAGSTGEVLSQDSTTGWIEAIFPLNESGAHEPYHVRCFLEPSDIESTQITPPGPFIRRKT